MGPVPSHSAIDPAHISRYKKERFLLKMTEREFRDTVIRPLFLRKGLLDGRDLCGPMEEGKDCIFLLRNTLGILELYAVQTKRGKLTFASDSKSNVVTAETQLRMALRTDIVLLENRQRIKPHFVVLCASGKINERARRYIARALDDPRIIFLDSDSLIPDIDAHYPELWWGIDAHVFPYLKSLREHLLRSSDTIAFSELQIEGNPASPITDEVYVPLYLTRVIFRPRKRRGQVYQEPELEQIPVEGILKRRDALLIIVGEAGAGKTTALRRFAYKMAERALASSGDMDIPVLLKSVDISATKDRLVDIAGGIAARFAPGEKPPFSTKDLHEGRVTLMVDALDEVPEDDLRRQVAQRILDFNREYPACRVILSSRNYDFVARIAELGMFTRFTMIPIDLRQAERLVEKLARGRSLPVEAAQETLRQLHEVHGIDLSPLLVTVFVATSDYARRDIPANVTELFKKFTEMMLGRWDQKKGLSQQYQAPLKDFLLQKLAYHMHSGRMTRLPLPECKGLIMRELGERGHEADLEVLFDEIVYRSGLLRVVKDEVQFRHVLLQEFFAGRGVPGTDFFAGLLGDDWWKKPLVFYFGEHPDASDKLRELVRSCDQLQGAQLYEAAAAIGVANQACYLSRLPDRESILNWVIVALARAMPGYLECLAQEVPKTPLTAFILYYLYGRDAVASQAVRKVAQKILGDRGDQVSSASQDEACVFWCVVGLIEAGYFAEAEQVVRSWRPSDLRLLLAVHLSAFMAANLRMTPKEHKAIAERICERIGPRIAHLTAQVLKEWKSMLLEIRGGEVKALDSPEARD